MAKTTPDLLTTTQLMNRKERIVILPHNTLRIMDLPIHYELLRHKGIEPQEVNIELFRLCNRIDKDLVKFNNLPATINPIIDETLKTNWLEYYELAPKTMFYDMLKVLQKQRFIESLSVLFPVPDVKDDEFDSASYDGSIEELEKYINNVKMTMLVLDDFQLLGTLTERKNINFDQTTIFISRMAYNYMYDKELSIFKLKDYETIADRYAMEIGVFGLLNFTKETKDAFNEYLKKEKGESKQ